MNWVKSQYKVPPRRLSKYAVPWSGNPLLLAVVIIQLVPFVAIPPAESTAEEPRSGSALSL